MIHRVIRKNNWVRLVAKTKYLIIIYCIACSYPFTLEVLVVNEA